MSDGIEQLALRVASEMHGAIDESSEDTFYFEPHELIGFLTRCLAELEKQQEPVATVQCINGVTIGYLDKMLPVGTKLYHPALLPPAAVPDGWKLVPVEPTLEMLKSAMLAIATESEGIITTTWLRNAVYRAMLSSAPVPPSDGRIAHNLKEVERTLDEFRQLAEKRLERIKELERIEARYVWLTKHAYIGEFFTENGRVFEVHNTDREVPIEGPVDDAIDAAIASVKGGAA